MRRFVASLSFVMAAAFGASASAQTPAVVVELFTSQGCSSCPPADAMMHELATHDDIIALAFHVDYWDYIGWADTWGSAENTARQHAYAEAAGSRTVYTPQFVIGGAEHVIGARGMELMDAIANQRSQKQDVTLTAERSGDMINLRVETGDPQPMTVQLVRYSPVETVDIERGENAGETITYANTVMEWTVLTEWDGDGMLDVTADASGPYESVVIVQSLGAGPILAAVTID